MEQLTKNRLRIWLAFYAVTLAASFAAMGILSLIIPLATWKLVAIGIWLLACFSSLCFPDNILDRWLPKDGRP